MIKFSGQGNSIVEDLPEVQRLGLWKSGLWLFIGFIFMLLGSEVLVRGSIGEVGGNWALEVVDNVSTLMKITDLSNY